VVSADARPRTLRDLEGDVSVIDLIERQALTMEESSFGAVGLVHSGPDLEAWLVRKDDEDVEPTLAVMDRDDLLVVIEGSLRLELDGEESRLLRAGHLCVIPAGTPFRGYRWPRDGEACLFLAVTLAGANFRRL
jgi:mannose-6-phosphate isomerase-like protein (cupin superfamily)